MTACRFSPRTIVLFLLVPSALASPYDHSGIGASSGNSNADGSYGDGSSPGEVHDSWTSWQTLVLIHGLCGLLAWQVTAPLAAVVATFRPTWGSEVGWLKLHWRLQALITFPLTVAAVVLGLIATRLGSGGITVHHVLGLLLLAALWCQIGLGYRAHSKRAELAEKAPSTPTSSVVSPTHRFTVKYAHVILGLVLLGAGGIQVELGLRLYDGVATWVWVIHYILAIAPPLILLPIFVVRGLRRRQRGATFAEAFLNRSPSSRYQPPRKLWLGESGYLEGEDSPISGGGRRGRAVSSTGHGGREDDADGEGFEYAVGAGAGGRQSVAPVASSWQGHETREEYEASIMSAAVDGGADGEGGGLDGEGAAQDEGSALLSSAGGVADDPSRSETYPGRYVPNNNVLRASAVPVPTSTATLDISPRPSLTASSSSHILSPLRSDPPALPPPPPPPNPYAVFLRLPSLDAVERPFQNLLTTSTPPVPVFPPVPPITQETVDSAVQLPFPGE